MGDDLNLSSDTTRRIDMLSDTDVAYWCRLFDVDHTELRRAVQKVGPRADAVARVLGASRAPREEESGF